MDEAKWKERFAPLAEVQMPADARQRVLGAIDLEGAELLQRSRPMGARGRNGWWWAGSVAVAGAVVAYAMSQAPGQPTPPAPLSSGPVASSTSVPMTSSSGPATTTPGVPAGRIAFSAIHMVDGTSGWAVGTANQVYRTTDGGVRWVAVTPQGVTGPKSMRVGFAAVDAKHAWLAAMNAVPSGSQVVVTVYRTADGGQTWQQATASVQSQGGGAVAQVQFLDPQTGFILVHLGGAMGSEGVDVLSTTDGGVRWQIAAQVTPSSPAFAGIKSGFAFADANDGYMTGVWPGDSILFYASHDGGKTWQTQNLPVPSGYSAQGGGAQSMPPVFFSSQNGILPVAFSQTGHPTIFYATNDGGRTWTPGTAIQGGSNSLVWSFAVATHGFATNGSSLFVTQDGGRHWTTIHPNRSLAGVQALDFATAQKGWAVVGGKLLKTSDGGQTWTAFGASSSSGAGSSPSSSGP